MVTGFLETWNVYNFMLPKLFATDKLNFVFQILNFKYLKSIIVFRIIVLFVLWEELLP